MCRKRVVRDMFLVRTDLASSLVILPWLWLIHWPIGLNVWADLGQMVRFSWLFSRCSVSPLIHTSRDRKRKSKKPKNLCQTPALRRSDTPMIPQTMRFSIQIPDFHAHTNNRFQKIYAKFIFPIIRGNRKLHYLRNSTIAPERREGAFLAFSAYDPCHLSSG